MLTEEQLRMIADDPRRFLNQCYKLQERILAKERQVEQLEAVAVQITSTIKPVSAYTGPGNKIADCAIAITDLQREIQADIQNLTELWKIVDDGIYLCVSDLLQRSILEARYLSGMRWEEIAYEYHFAYRWVLRLHKKALVSMGKKAEELLNGKTE